MPAGSSKPSAARGDVSAALRAALGALERAEEMADIHGFQGTLADINQIYIELLRVESSLWAWHHRAWRALPVEDDWLRPELPF